MAQTSENMAGCPKADLIVIPADQYFPLSSFTAQELESKFQITQNVALQLLSSTVFWDCIVPGASSLMWYLMRLKFFHARESYS